MSEQNQNPQPLMNDGEMEKVTLSTAEMLKKQKKVKVKLHLDPTTKKKLEEEEAAGKKVEWPSHFVGINGYNYQIQLGKSVDVPESVAEVLEQAGLI